MVIIGFSTPKKFKVFSHLIRTYQGGTDYSHMYIRILDNRTGKWIVYEASYGYLHAISYDKFKNENHIFHEYEIEMNYVQQLEILKFCQESLQKLYGFWTILGILTNRHIGNDGDKTFICSEFVIRLLEVAGLLEYAYDVDYITPKEAKGLILRLNNEGKLNINKYI